MGFFISHNDDPIRDPIHEDLVSIARGCAGSTCGLPWRDGARSTCSRGMLLGGTCNVRDFILTDTENWWVLRFWVSAGGRRFVLGSLSATVGWIMPRIFL
jgi:hypothetical protein